MSSAVPLNRHIPVRRLLGFVPLVAVLAAVAFFVDVPAVVRVALNLDPGGIAILFGIHVANRVLMGFKWGVLLWWNGARIGVLSLIKAYFVSAFSAPFLPPSVGADAVRMLIILDRTEPASLVLPSIIVEKLLASLAMAWMVLVAMALLLGSEEISNAGLLLSAALLSVGMMMAIALFPFLLRFEWFWAVLRRFGKKVSGAVGGVLLDAGSMVRNYKSSAAFVALSILEQLSVVILMWILLREMRIDASFYTIALVTTLSLFAGRLPVSIGGFAVQDGTMVALLSVSGMSLEEATALALTARALEFLFNLPAIVFLGGVSDGLRSLLANRGSLFSGRSR